MVTTSKDKVQCFTLKTGKVTCKDNVTGRQLRKKNGRNATPGTIRVKKGSGAAARANVARQKRGIAAAGRKASTAVAARTRSKVGARPRNKKKLVQMIRPKKGTAAMKAKMARMRAMKKK